MPCTSMYYNATLAQQWPRGAHTLYKHMRQVCRKRVAVCCSILQCVAVCCSVCYKSTCGRYSNGSRYWHGWALEFILGFIYKAVHVGFLQQVQIQSWCWPVAELESSALAVSLVSLIVHPVVHVCIRYNPAQKVRDSQKQDMYHLHLMFSTYFETHASWALAH